MSDKKVTLEDLDSLAMEIERLIEELRRQYEEIYGKKPEPFVLPYWQSSP